VKGDPMKKNAKYQMQMAGGIFGSGLALYVVSHLYDKISYYKVLVLLTMLPFVYSITIIFRAVSEMDEMWKKIVIDAMAFSGLATGFSCFGYLFLREMGAPEFQLHWVFTLMWGYFLLGSIWAKRRYR
jgi:hypothetical protein